MIVLNALSIHQPWAWAIVNGHKNIENRSRNFRYRGDLLVHSSKSTKTEEFNAARAFLFRKGVRVPERSQLSFGSVIGRVQLVDCNYRSSYFHPWGMPLHYHLEFENPIAFELPIPFSGRQGLFKVMLPTAYGPDYTGFLENIFPLIEERIRTENSWEEQLVREIRTQVKEGRLKGYYAYKLYHLIANNQKVLKDIEIHVPPCWEALSPFYR